MHPDRYSAAQRAMQEHFQTRPLADRANETIVHDMITDEEKAFIETRDLFFIATVDDRGRPQCSYKGGDVGFVRVVDEKTIAFPSYDGNGMFLTTGNVLANPDVGILFIDFENPRRLRLNGTATVHYDDALLHEYVEAQLMIRVTVREIFLNCPRYVHKFHKMEHSVYVPKAGCETPIPEWKLLDEVQDVLPDRDKKKIAARKPGP